jgi:hypothetical protein
MKIQVEFSWVLTPNNVVVGYLHPSSEGQHGPLKRWYPTTILHGVTTQKNLDLKHNHSASLETRCILHE